MRLQGPTDDQIRKLLWQVAHTRARRRGETRVNNPTLRMDLREQFYRLDTQLSSR